MNLTTISQQLAKLMKGQKELPVTLTFEADFNDLYISFASNPEKLKYLELDGISPDKVDVGAMSHKYFTQRLADTSVDMNANANEELSANNYQSEVTKGVLKLEGYYLIWRYMNKRFGLERANQAIKAIWNGDLYFHDASGHGVQIPYCFAFSTTPIMLEGRPYGQLHSLPPKRSDSFVSQVIEVCMDLSEFAGAVAPSDFIVNLCYFLKKEGINPHESSGQNYIINLWQKFVHVMNNKFRVSGQSPFTNISIFDRQNLKNLFGHNCFPDSTYIDIEYTMTVQKIVADWFSKGDPDSNLPYRFPILTVNISVDENRNVIDTDFLEFVSETNIDKGIYNIYVNEGTKIAMCCRLINDIDRMSYRTDSFGNGGLNIGSHRIITINFPRIAQLSKNEEHFFELLNEQIEIVKDLLLVHREEILGRRVKAGFLKFFNPLNWFNLNMFFSTIGITGIYEMCYFLKKPIETKEGQVFVEKLLLKLEEYALISTQKYGHSFNIEEIPAETASIIFAKKDKIANFSEQPFELYSNQYIPLISDLNPIERLSLSGKFMNLVSGGGIVHLNIAEQIKNSEIMKTLIINSLKLGVTHFAINYGFGICEEGHTSIIGNASVCPICGKKVIDYLTRIIGYFTKVSSWSKTRKNFEFPLRKFK